MRSYNFVSIFLFHIILGAHYRLKWFFSWTVRCTGEFDRSEMQQVIESTEDV